MIKNSEKFQVIHILPVYDMFDGHCSVECKLHFTGRIDLFTLSDRPLSTLFIYREFMYDKADNYIYIYIYLPSELGETYRTVTIATSTDDRVLLSQNVLECTVQYSTVESCNTQLPSISWSWHTTRHATTRFDRSIRMCLRALCSLMRAGGKYCSVAAHCSCAARGIGRNRYQNSIEVTWHYVRMSAVLQSWEDFGLYSDGISFIDLNLLQYTIL